MTELEIARREFETADGVVTLSIVAKESEAPAMSYRFSRGTGEVFETLTVYGADSMQALLFCLTAAGDYLRARIPSASFARTGSAGLPITDLAARGEWLAHISMPAGEPPGTSPGVTAGFGDELGQSSEAAGIPPAHVRSPTHSTGSPLPVAPPDPLG